MMAVVFSARLSFAFLLFLSVICLSKPENSTVEKIQKTESGEINRSLIKYNLITDEISEPNKFHISYEVSYGEFIFKRLEKCYVVEGVEIPNNSSEISCSGKTQFSRTGDDKNVTNFDDYMYSSNGFNHTGETFKVSGNYFRLNEIDLLYGLQAEPISSKLNVSQAVRKLQFDPVDKNNLYVNFTINSTYFAMNRTENFLLALDEETNTDELRCVGEVSVTMRNSDIYQTVQKEVFSLDESYSFVYVSEIELLNNHSNTNN